MFGRRKISFYRAKSFIGVRFTEGICIFFSLGEKSSQSRKHLPGEKACAAPSPPILPIAGHLFLKGEEKLCFACLLE
jgi:hypothetical protein